MENEEQSKRDQELLKISSKLKKDLLRDLYLDVNQRLFGNDNHLKSTLINPYEDLWK